MNNIFNNFQIIKLTGKIFTIEKKEEACCNEVYLIGAEKGKFIIKIANEKTRQLELDKEYNLINNLQNFVCLPKIYLYKKEKNYSFFVMEYIEGNKPNLFTENILKKMAMALKKIHKSQQIKYNVDFDKLIVIAENNLINNKIDLDEFIKDNKFIEPKQILIYLKENKPKAKACLLHGDFRPKNMLIKNNDLFVLDWGLSFVGDCYYDLAIIKWYFSEEEFNKFIEFYGIKKLDTKRLEYNEWLSSFLNV